MTAVNVVRQAVVGGEEKVRGVDLRGILVVDVVRMVWVVRVQHVREGSPQVWGVTRRGVSPKPAAVCG